MDLHALGEEVQGGLVPRLLGEGELRVVVRDLLGREQVLSERYYASPRLLRPGVTDFSYEAGFVRENFALASNDYGRFFAAATWRRGFAERFTGELRAEGLHKQQTVGASGRSGSAAAGASRRIWRSSSRPLASGARRSCAWP